MLPFPEIERIAEPPAPALDGSGTPWQWWIAAGLLAVILAILMLWWLRIAARRVALPALPGKPDRIALRSLEDLRKRSEKLDAIAFAGQLHGIVRSFMQRRLGVPARFSTTAELLGRARHGDLPPPTPAVLEFAPVMEACDAIKYGTSSGGEGPSPHSTPVNRAALIDMAAAGIRAAALPLPVREPAPPALPEPPTASAAHV